MSREAVIRHAKRPFVISHCSFLLGLGLTAFFWLPAIVETRWVHIERAYLSPGLDYRHNFIPLSEILALPRSFDPRLILPVIPKGLGWPQLLLASLGCALALWLGRRVAQAQRTVVVFTALGLVLTTFMTTSASVVVWERLPFLRLAQFPWRLLGHATLFAAIMAGCAVGLLGAVPALSRLRPVAPLAVLAVTAFYALTGTFAPRTAGIVRPSIRDVQAYEARYALGTTTAAEYLPLWVQELPDAGRLAARYASAPVIERLDRESLPPAVTVTASDSTLHSARVTLDAPEAFTVVFDWFYFPGWRAAVDGRAAPIRITDPHGLISVAVPAGRHTVSVRFGESPLRALADGVSLAAFVALLAVWGAWGCALYAGNAWVWA